jgi:DNA polymerase I-like protein with 3'-5' exonuclease and polymerase domains
MLINLDAKSLEWVTAVYLSGDQVGRQELKEGFDIHSRNQDALHLPTRTIAKIFLFRTIYCDEGGGGAYAFANDPEFAHVSSSTRYWQERIDAFYLKYKGLAKWHTDLLVRVGQTGRLSMPYGREYVFLRKEKNGEKLWPKTQIYNYPVQGLGAELMAIVRVSLAKRLAALVRSKVLAEYKLIATVHDSVLIDAPQEALAPISTIVYNVFRDVPKNFERLFGIPFDLDLNVEIQAGPTWGNMEVIDKETILSCMNQ